MRSSSLPKCLATWAQIVVRPWEPVDSARKIFRSACWIEILSVAAHRAQLTYARPQTRMSAADTL
eukprot:7941384-Ditylum_brightwellii.AAC.1